MFTVFDYPMSYLEFIGTIFTIWCVWLTTRAKILSWPVGLIGSFLYLFLFYQIQLYSDFMEQIYFIVTGIIGWYMWVRFKKDINQENKSIKTSINTWRENAFYLALTAVGTGILTYATMNFDKWFPKLFSQPVSYPFLDAVTTVMSFIAQWLLMKKRAESWILWILVDAIDIGLYWVKGVRFVSLEYALFFCIAIFGLINWLKIYRKNK
jgi:nicotinamide mononucleotide transporter